MVRAVGKSEYGVRPGGRLPGGKTAAAVVGSELEAIDEQDGGISAQAVVSRARTPGTALHAWDHIAHYFQWDDTAAAEGFREEQARQLIRAVRVTVETGDERLSTRGFLALAGNGQRASYRPVDTVTVNPDAHREVVTRFQNEMLRIDAAYRAYLSYADFAMQFREVFDAVDHVMDRLAAEGEPRARQRQKERYRRRGGQVELVTE